MKKVVFVTIISLIFFTGKSQILINEYNVSNLTGIVDDFGKNSDWVELYNNLNIPQSLNGYYLTNDKNNLFKWKFPDGIVLPAFSHTLVWCTGRNTNTIVPNMHTNFDLEQSKKQPLWLVRGNGVVADSVQLRPTKADHAWARIPDGGPWHLVTGAAEITPNAVNPAATVAASTYTNYAPIPVFTVSPLAGGGPAPAGFGVFPQIDFDFDSYDTTRFTILYTEDGSYPATGVPIWVPGNAQTLVYDAPSLPIIISAPPVKVVRAICVAKDATTALEYAPSFCETNTYLNAEQETPGFAFLSICMDTTFFSTAATKTVHIEYFDNSKFISEGYASITKPLFDSWNNNLQRGFDVDMKDERGFGGGIIAKVFNDPNLGVSTRTFFPKFSVKVAGEDNFSGVLPALTNIPKGTHMRDAFAQTYALKNGLDIDPLHYKPIKVYINGEYRGIYEFREFYDDKYFNHYYGHHADSIDVLGVDHLGNNQILSGVDTGWVTAPLTLYDGAFNYVRNYPVNNKPFFDGASLKINTNSLLDFAIYNSYLVNTDLMKVNNMWWRGTTESKKDRRWRYMMIDMNNILDLNYTPASLPASNMTVSPCIYTQLGGSSTSYTTAASTYTGHGFVLNRLMTYAPFRENYITRYMDMVNSVFKCDKMLAHYNYFRTMFEPEMYLHTVYYASAPITSWLENMDTLQERIKMRCEKINPLLKQCLNLKGPYNVTVKVRPENAGTVDYNSLHLANFTWNATYYNAFVSSTVPFLSTNLKANPIDTSIYAFDHWEFDNHKPEAPKTERDNNVTLNLITHENIVAVFVDKRQDIVMPTAFTPNGDGLNDVLIPLSARYAKDYEFQVWNRWGQEVFRSNKNTEGWDGTFNGEKVQPGVYAYVIKYKNTANESKVLKGNVTLIR